MKRAATELITTIKRYAIAVCEQESHKDVGKLVATALETAGKVSNRVAKNKCQPVMEDWLLAWARQKDIDGKLEDLLKDERWEISPDEASKFLSKVRPAIDRLATAERHNMAQRYRKDVHDIVVQLSAEGQVPEVCTSCLVRLNLFVGSLLHAHKQTVAWSAARYVQRLENQLDR